MEAVMAECVSCGKDIPAGKFFCDECYVKMKGQRGMLKKVPPASGVKTGGETSPTATSDDTERSVKPVVPDGIVPEKKARGTLTPASGKKVVSMKPATDKAAKEKAGKKKFTVTISFSERTYAALARMKRKKKEEAPLAKGKSEISAAAPALQRKGRRSKGPHGRPKLKAVASSKKPATQNRGGFMGLIAYRERKLDRRDIISAALASFAVLMIFVLSFTSWAKVSWSEGGESSMQTVKIKGFDLGAMTYICIAIVAVAYLYMVATWLFKGPFTKIDYGVVLIVAGIIFIPIFFATISSTSRLLSVALEKAGRRGNLIPPQYERQTLWPAYIIVLMGAVLGFSGLIRLSERKSVETASDA
jgi:hypothetical protein